MFVQRHSYFAHRVVQSWQNGVLVSLSVCLCDQRILPCESYARLHATYSQYCQLRSLRSVVLPDLSSTTPVTVSQAQRKRRITFLFLEAVIQVIYMGILVRV